MCVRNHATHRELFFQEDSFSQWVAVSGHPPAADPLVKMSEITLILEAAKNGDSEAAEKLLPLVYDESRGLATGSDRSTQLRN